MELLHEGSRERFTSVPRQIWETTAIIKEQSKLSPNDFLRLHEKEIRSAFPGSMRRARGAGAIPVMICALNETENIGRTLYGLSRSDTLVQPIVVDNGSIDGTGDFVRKLGAEVIHEEKRGMLNALRGGFTYFRDMNYKGPILFTDADTVPLPIWTTTMAKHAQRTIPGGGEAFGRVFHYDYDGTSHVLKNAAMSAGVNILAIRAMKKGESKPQGANCIIVTDGGGQILGALSRINSPRHVNQGTDETVRDTIRSTGNHISFCGDARALVVTSGRRYPYITDVIQRVLSKQKTGERLYRD